MQIYLFEAVVKYKYTNNSNGTRLKWMRKGGGGRKKEIKVSWLMCNGYIIASLTVAAALAVSSLQRPRGRVRERVWKGV